MEQLGGLHWSTRGASQISGRHPRLGQERSADARCEESNLRCKGQAFVALGGLAPQP